MASLADARGQSSVANLFLCEKSLGPELEAPTTPDQRIPRGGSHRLKNWIDNAVNEKNSEENPEMISP